MKSLLSLGTLLVSSVLCFGQLNMTLLDNIDYDAELNDVWGYADPNTGIEYALVGAVNGVSIVSLEDPDNIVEVAFIPGQASDWRDIKTWGQWAYVVADKAGTTEGLTVIDLRDLPNSAPFFHWTPNLPNLGTLRKCHNLFIDENGYAYLAGCNVNSGGMLYIDVFSEPGNPIFVDAGPNSYSHDVFVRGDTMYSSEIDAGRLAIYEVSDKSNSQFIAAQATPFAKTHNAWLSDDSQVVFTTDELADAPVVAYGLSDLNDIEELDQYRPIATLQQGVIPHNVHVWQDWLIISYYTDGGRVVDASRPHNLIEVGNFDTFFGGSTNGFDGVWGAYPFLPSGKVLLTDIGNGLYVLDANYVRACWLEGKVTDAEDNAPLNNVLVSIDAEQANQANSFLDGTYESGLATAGTYEVLFYKEGYQPLAVNADLDNGVVTELDVQLQREQLFNLQGSTVVDASGDPVPGAEINITGPFFAANLTSDENGLFSLSDFAEGTYEVYVGAWGYQTQYLEDYSLVEGEEVVFALAPAYEDDFVLDLGWSSYGIEQADGEELTGFWERGEPIGTYFSSGALGSPEEDIDGDLGDFCYVTGNSSFNLGVDDVDDGQVFLVSPPMDLTSYADPAVAYNLWFRNGGGSGSAVDDQLVVSVSNGIDTVVIEVVEDGTVQEWRERSVFLLQEVIDITDEMRIHFETSDFDPTGHIVEAGVDAFAVTDGIVSTSEPAALIDWQTSPNPFEAEVLVTYQLPEEYREADLSVYDLWGRKLQQYRLANGQSQLTVGQNLPSGLYLLQISADGQLLATKKVVKQ